MKIDMRIVDWKHQTKYPMPLFQSSGMAGAKMWHKCQRIILRRAAHSQRVELTVVQMVQMGVMHGAMVHAMDIGGAWYRWKWCMVRMVVVLSTDGSGTWYRW